VENIPAPAKDDVNYIIYYLRFCWKHKWILLIFIFLYDCYGFYYFQQTKSPNYRAEVRVLTGWNFRLVEDIVKSDALRDSVIYSLQLYKDYGIDTTKPEWQGQMNSIFNSSLRIRQGLDISVNVIEYFSSNREVSAKVVKRIAKMLNIITRKIWLSRNENLTFLIRFNDIDTFNMYYPQADSLLQYALLNNTIKNPPNYYILSEPGFVENTNNQNLDYLWKRLIQFTILGIIFIPMIYLIILYSWQKWKEIIIEEKNSTLSKKTV